MQLVIFSDQDLYLLFQTFMSFYVYVLLRQRLLNAFQYKASNYLYR